MNDLISRQAAIDIVRHECGEWKGLAKEIVKQFNGLPSVQPYNTDEWCHDCSEYNHEKHCCPRYNEEIKESKTGHWILQPSNKEQGERDFIWWKCSECGQVIYSETEKDRREYHAFCGRCGKRMIESQESE